MQCLKWLFGRGRRYEDLSVSIEEHIEERAEELIDEGMTRKQAEQTARHEFGNVTLLRERSREEWQWSGLESILADIKFTFRRLRRLDLRISPAVCVFRHRCISLSPSRIGHFNRWAYGLRELRT